MKKLSDIFRKKPKSPASVKQVGEDTFPARLPGGYSGPEAVRFLGEVRLLQFLNYLRIEDGPGTFTAFFFEELEKGASLEDLFAIKEEKTEETFDEERDLMKTAYTLGLQETQQELCFSIWFGHYADIPLGRTLGYMSTEYFVTFDEAGNVQKVKLGGFMMT